MKYGFIIPVYNHGATLESVVKNLLSYNFPIIIVDDGNNEENKKYIREVEKSYQNIVIVTLPTNCGKGFALIEGAKKAKELGITHFLQIDSDGQHDASKVKTFLELSEKNPEAIICAYPEYEKDAPKARVKGRKFANGWIHIVTLSNEIKDGMIGFRIYPVESMLRVVKKSLYIDSRMGFDIDILVRMYWAKVPVINESVKIFYPENGISNYRYFQDTVRVSLTYARLCLGMFVRFPLLIVRKCCEGTKKYDKCK